MGTPAEYTTSNILNSVSLYLADKFLSEGVLCYWHAADALQIASSPTGWYYEFNANRAAILADGTVAAAVSASRAIVSMLSAYPAEPRFIHRLINDASLGPEDEVPVPSVVIDVTPVKRTQPYELGTVVKWRSRGLLVEVYGRDQHEQRWFADVLERVLEQDQMIAVLNHDAGTLASVGHVAIDVPTVGMDTYLDASEALAYQVVAGAYLRYVA